MTAVLAAVLALGMMVAVAGFSMWLGFRQHRAEVGESASRRQVRQSVPVLFLISSAVLFGVVLALALGALGVQPALTVMWLIIALGGLGIALTLKRWRDAGPTLVQIPRGRRQPFAVGGWSVITLFQLMAFARGGDDTFLHMGHAIQATWWFVLILGYLPRPSVRAAGILYQASLVRWRSIAGYRWEGDTGSTLTLRRHRTGLTGRLGFSPDISMSVPLQDRERIDSILRERIGNARSVTP